MCYAEVCWWLGSVDHLLSPDALGESLLVFLERCWLVAWEGYERRMLGSGYC